MFIYISFRRPPFSIPGFFKVYFQFSKIHDDTKKGKYVHQIYTESLALAATLDEIGTASPSRLA